MVGKWESFERVLFSKISKDHVQGGRAEPKDKIKGSRISVVLLF